MSGARVALESAGLLERSQELCVLGERLATVAAASRGATVLVHGEAGIGKTALLRGFCDELGPSTRVLWAACDALFTPRPLGPLLDIARLVGGELAERVESGAKPHDVAAALLRELEAPAPTIVVLEDLHWADEATLDVVRLLARRVEAVPALLVVSYRDEQVDRTHPLRVVLGELPSDGSATRVGLATLSPRAVASLAEPAGVDAAELYERTAGNPFFVTEALAAHIERIPLSIRDAVLARAARLSESSRALLDAMAVVPQRAELWLLDAMGLTEPSAMEECLSSGMLGTDGEAVSFRHELARLAVEDSLAPGRRRDLHRRALEALAARGSVGADLSRLAHHAEAAGDAAAVLRFAPAAAEHAAALGAHREAGRQYERALRFAESLAPAERADLLEAFANEGYLTDMREEAIAALDEGLEIRRAGGSAVHLAAMLRLRSRLLACIGRATDARADAHAALEALTGEPPGPELARAYSTLSAEAMLADDLENTIAWGRRAIELAERFDDILALVQALTNVGTMELIYGRDGGRERLERSIALAREAELETEVGRAYINLGAALGRRRQWTLADPHLDAGIAFCSERGLEAWERCLLAARAESELAQGRWSAASELASALMDSPASVLGPRYSARCVLGVVRTRRGDPGNRQLLDEALAIAESVGDLEFLAPVAAARAEAAWLDGRPELVGEETDRALGLALAAGERMLAGELVTWRRRAGIADDVPADALAEPFSLQVGATADRAAAQWRELGCPYEAALALFDGDAEAGLRRALDELQALGARPAAAIVARRLRERGARGLPRGPRTRTRANPAGLTPRELEVLALVAEGLRNAEISERLVVAEKTVDHHVSAILRKLGVRGRAEATAEAFRLGLLAQDR